MKVIRTYRKATATDYARAAAKASPVISGGHDHIALAGIASTIGGLLGGGSGNKMKKKEFYQKRDKFFAAAKQYGKPVDSLPGNPFTQFSHSTIKDSPFKDYSKEWSEFINMVRIYYPEFISAAGTITDAPTNTVSASQVVAPLNPVMDKALRDAGLIPNEQNLEQFVETVVTPATGQDYKDAGKEALANAAIEFISTLTEKKKQGETLPPMYDKIAGGAMKVEEGIENKVRQNVEENVGAFVTDNILFIGLGLALLLVAIMSKK